MGIFKKREPEPYKEPEPVEVDIFDVVHEYNVISKERKFWHTFVVFSNGDVMMKLRLSTSQFRDVRLVYVKKIHFIDQYIPSNKSSAGGYIEIGSLRYWISKELTLKGFAHGEKWYKENHKPEPTMDKPTAGTPEPMYTIKPSVGTGTATQKFFTYADIPGAIPTPATKAPGWDTITRLSERIEKLEQQVKQLYDQVDPPDKEPHDESEHPLDITHMRKLDKPKG
jgi:hypothetical protein